MLGGKIIWSGANVSSEKSNFSGAQETIQIHAIKTKQSMDSKKIGLEIRSKSYMHISIQPFRLSAAQAKQLSDDLKEAVSKIET
ncbi:MAG: hypothetical protein Alis3KO_41330 [Aliiglaciecola sp.]